MLAYILLHLPLSSYIAECHPELDILAVNKVVYYSLWCMNKHPDSTEAVKKDMDLANHHDNNTTLLLLRSNSSADYAKTLYCRHNNANVSKLLHLIAMTHKI